MKRNEISPAKAGAPFTLLLLAAALALALSACSKETSVNEAKAAEPPALPADVAGVAEVTQTVVPVEADTIAGAVEATGEFQSPVRSEVAPRIQGRVARLYVDEGSRVRRGQPVLEMETDYIRINLQQAEAELARATAMANEARRDLDRKKELIARDSIPRATFDRSQAMFDQANAARASANAMVSMYRQQLADSTVRSPIDGIVAEKRTEVGQKLGDGAVTFVIVQVSPLKLRFRVPERYLGRVRPGQTVTATVDPYPGETFTGTIKTVGGVIDASTRTMFAEAEFPNRDGRLRPGLFARVEAKLN